MTSLDVHPDITSWDQVRKLYAFCANMNVQGDQKLETFLEALSLGKVILPLDALEGGAPLDANKPKDPFRGKTQRDLEEQKRRTLVGQYNRDILPGFR